MGGYGSTGKPGGIESTYRGDAFIENRHGKYFASAFLHTDADEEKVRPMLSRLKFAARYAAPPNLKEVMFRKHAIYEEMEQLKRDIDRERAYGSRERMSTMIGELERLKLKGVKADGIEKIVGSADACLPYIAITAHGKNKGDALQNLHRQVAEAESLLGAMILKESEIMVCLQWQHHVEENYKWILKNSNPVIRSVRFVKGLFRK
ncbi:Uncharacterised protein [Candidatus Gugararchaeum adminiculabundum]|nr:Uncharacterised protein [Candidatus Gugararchaeum adminiculabundum]